MANNNIVIDSTKCIGCSLCIKDCPGGHLRLENGKAVPNEFGCIECGHCYAICPQSAVSMNGYTDDGGKIKNFSDFNGDELLQAIKSRRSVRQFKPEPIEPEITDKILEAGRYSPTGANAQDVRYIVLGSKQDEIEQECVKLFRSGTKLAAPFVKMLSKMNISDNFFFKDAPLVIVVSAKSNINAGLASAYMEMVANSFGLGVLYSGFFVMCSKISSKIKKSLKLSNGEKVVSCMVIGYPNVKYHRIAPRKPLNVTKL